MDWMDFLAVQGTLKSLLQHHSSKGSILWRSAFFLVQLSYPYMTTNCPSWDAIHVSQRTLPTLPGTVHAMALQVHQVVAGPGGAWRVLCYWQAGRQDSRPLIAACAELLSVLFKVRRVHSQPGLQAAGRERTLLGAWAA